MKQFELIPTENYLLICSDDEIKKNDYFLHCKRILKADKSKYINAITYDKDTHLAEHNCNKIIAHLPLNNAPLLEGVMLLPELVVEDVEKLAEEVILKEGSIYKDAIIGKQKWIEGYKAATKVYSEDDLRKVVELTLEDAKISVIWSDTYHKHLSDNIIQSLKQPKYPKYFEAEMEWVNSRGETGKDFTDVAIYKESIKEYDAFLREKTTTNQQRQIVLVGTYKYE